MPFFSFLLFSLSFHQKWKKINLQSKLHRNTNFETALVWKCTRLCIQFWPFWPDLDQIWLKFDPIWNCTCLLELHLHNTWILKKITGNRGLEICCNGFGSAVFVAVYIGMRNGNRWNYTQSTFNLWYARADWCKGFRDYQLQCSQDTSLDI